MKNPVITLLTLSVLIVFSSCNQGKSTADVVNVTEEKVEVKIDSVKKKMVPTIDTVDYNKRMIAISNNDTTGRWPVKAPYPLPGAILPYNRIIAFYGNLYSTRMGILGEIPRAQIIEKLQG
jgi:hypothetical protein